MTCPCQCLTFLRKQISTTWFNVWAHGLLSELSLITYSTKNWIIVPPFHVLFIMVRFDARSIMFTHCFGQCWVVILNARSYCILLASAAAVLSELLNTGLKSILKLTLFSQNFNSAAPVLIGVHFSAAKQNLQPL